MVLGRIATVLAVAAITTTAASAAVTPETPTNGLARTMQGAAPLDGAIRLAAARKYFVVLGSFRKRSAAQRRCYSFGDAYVVHTNDYPNFRNGYWACVIGPLTRGEAEDQMWASREAVRDAYVKAGW